MSIQSKSELKDNLSPEHRELVERFLAAFNTIDHELRHRLGVGDEVSLREVIEEYARRHQFWTDGKQLQTFRDLRNFVVHHQTLPFQRLAIPAPEVVDAIEAIYQRLSERIIPRFQRPVTAIKSSDSLADVLKLINSKDYSQFPIYDNQGRYWGLLTENGITRWLAWYTVQQITLIEFEEVSVESVFQQEEKRINCIFIAAKTAVQVMLSKFSQNPSLEAVLITNSGKDSEKLLGIVTRWDIFNQL